MRVSGGSIRVQDMFVISSHANLLLCWTFFLFFVFLLIVLCNLLLFFPPETKDRRRRRCWGQQQVGHIAGYQRVAGQWQVSEEAEQNGSPHPLRNIP